MKKTLAILLLTALAAAPLVAGTNDVITNYFAGYVYVPASTTNAGSTGLTVSHAYLCVPAALLGVTATQGATATGDVRAVMYSINQQYQTAWAAKAAGARSATTPTRGTTYAASGTGVVETVTHILKTIRQFGTATLP